MLPSTVIIFITQEDIFSCDLVMYTFTDQCEEVAGLHLDDGTKKIFLNMTSKNGRPELISLLQYMKNTTLDNPEILVRDKRIRKLDQIVKEVKPVSYTHLLCGNCVFFIKNNGLLVIVSVNIGDDEC